MTDKEKDKLEELIFFVEIGVLNSKQYLLNYIKVLFLKKQKEIIDECYQRQKRKKVNQHNVEITKWSCYINNKTKMYQKYNIFN
jgi:hypothetical protein